MSRAAGAAKSAAPIRVAPTRVELQLEALAGRAWPLVPVLVLAGLLLLAPLMLFLHAHARPEAVAPLHYFASDEKDSHVFAMAKARAPERAAADVLVLGSSSAREALWTESELNRRGGGLRYWNLSSSGQNPLESLYLLEQQALRPGQTVALFISVRMLTPADTGERLRGAAFLVDASDFLRQQAALGAVAAPAVPDTVERLLNARQYLGKLLRRALPNQVRHRLYGSPPVGALEHYYEGYPPADPAFMRAAHERLRKGFEQHGEANLARLRHVIEQIAASCRRQGAILKVYEAPHRLSERAGLFAGWLPRYHEVLAQGSGLPVHDLIARLQLEPADFYDITHLNARGRERWSAAFVADLKAEEG